MTHTEDSGCAVIVGSTSGCGRNLAEALARRGEDVVITGRNLENARAVAAEIGPRARAVALDLTQPAQIRQALAGVGPVRHLVLAAIERDANTVRAFDVERATRLVTLKLVGYVEVVHALVDRLTPDASILLFGGVSRERPYPGSTTVTLVNGGVTSMARTLATELAPRRVNAVHPGVISDTPAWADNQNFLEPARARTPTGRLATMHDVTHAALFLLDNPAVNGVNLALDGGTTLV